MDQQFLAGLRRPRDLAEESVIEVSVVIPVYNGAATLQAALRSLMTQTLGRERYEVIVVDDGSRDDSAAIARSCGARTIVQSNAGAPAARNTGIREARGEWIAFTDADCVASRGWLAALLAAAKRESGCIGAAGKTIGFRSQAPAARFVDLMGGLDAGRYLQHPRFPFAPTANALYRREYLLEAGGFDERYATYDACDLHARIARRFAGAFPYEPRALIMHKHRESWRAYWRQQFFYGVGYAQFVLAHRDEIRWNVRLQLRALADVVAKGFRAGIPAVGDAAILRRGELVRAAAQQAGFIRAYYSAKERRRW